MSTGNPPEWEVHNVRPPGRINVTGKTGRSERRQRRLPLPGTHFSSEQHGGRTRTCAVLALAASSAAGRIPLCLRRWRGSTLIKLAMH